MNSQQTSSTTESRVIRVFVSSTFRDMQQERDELIKHIFPQLRKMCEQRGVTWGEVDLRWGITEEQSQSGQVLPICLAEIEHSRPYFIGLLGERYGWIPDKIDQELINEQGWLKDHLNCSVTELEILHGVLINPAMADHSLFYFRDSAFVETLSKEKRADFLELPTPEDIKQHGQAEAERRAEERREKLRALKQKIRDSHLPVCENYPTPQALGELVLQDMTAMINRLYPEGSAPDELERERLDHEAYARNRAKVYIGRQEYFDRLDAHARGDGQPLVVLGESGVGKSALLANWAIKYHEGHRDELLLMHFIGSSPYSVDWAAMLRRILREFKRHFNIEQEIPDQPDELRAAFANWLHMAAARGKVVLVLDALNQLEDRDGAPELVWLPPVIPPNVRLILSTLPGRPLDDLNKRGWQTLQVQPLTVAEREELVAKYLEQYSKKLNKERVERIAAADRTTNPLFLRALLDELRVFGEHQKLDERIGHYLSSQTIPELYTKILMRYEEDYERGRSGLVRDTMTLLWAARRGLSETELSELLGSNEQPLPRAYWSPLYLAAEPSLVNRSGLIGFAHEFIRQAVQDRYLGHEPDALPPPQKGWRSWFHRPASPPKSNQQPDEQAHLRLADYFDKHELSPRKIDELPWQLAEGAAWQRLSNLLAAREFFMAAWAADEFEVKGYWARVEAHSSLRMVDAYRAELNRPDLDSDFVWRLGVLLHGTGHPQEALAVQKSFSRLFRESGDRANLQASLGNQAVILKDRGELDEAMRLLKEQERLCRELGDKDGLSGSLGNQASILAARGELDEAMRLLKEAERLCRELGVQEGLALSLANQALILMQHGRSREALSLVEEAYRIATSHGLVALARQIKPNLDYVLSQNR